MKSIQPNLVGPKSFYLNPGNSVLTSANVGAIDTAIDPVVISPHAYTATVRDDYDARNFTLVNTGASLASGFRLAVGLFLSPQNDKGNFLYQLSGKVFLDSAVAAVRTQGSFFFGRKATDNTVVSSVVAAANTLAGFTLLPSNVFHRAVGSAGAETIIDSIQTDSFSLALSGGYVYCFGYFVDNYGGSSAVLNGSICLSFRKFTDSISVNSPIHS